MNLYTLILPATAAALILTGCATGKTEKNLNEKITQTPTAATHEEMRAETASEISNAPGLTEEQKAKLLALQSSVRPQFEEIHQRAMQLRSVLIQDIIDPNYNAKEVALIKKKIRENENKRLSLIFKTIDDANAIMGRNAKNNAHVVDDVLRPSGVGKFQ